ncbi:MAG: 30S ribosomal protein S5 [Thaumarchaeota archaeon]|nr:30S ribosomal protein S5 [Nitrososphaerota archaeon]MCL5317992.1 30S ribosomal protein S5 [Nitrososphaerota archaeon]
MERSRRYEEDSVKEWVPKTRLGSLVATGKVTSMDEIFENGWRIKEAEIVRTLLPDVRSEVVSAGIVQKQTDAGELTRFIAIVAVGDGHGWFGVGRGKAPQMRSAIEKATNNALLNIIPVRLGCGSWECKCGRLHSVPFKTSGKGGSVKVEMIPGPKGLGLVAGETMRNLLALAGIEDVWTRTYGSTSTASSLAYAIYDALKKIHGLNVMAV